MEEWSLGLRTDTLETGGITHRSHLKQGRKTHLKCTKGSDQSPPQGKSGSIETLLSVRATLSHES